VTFVRSRPSAASATVWAGYVLVATGLALISLEPRFGTPWWATALLGAAGLAVLAARGRMPALAFAGALALAVLSLAVGTGAECLLVAITLYRLGMRLPAIRAWVCFGVAMAFGALGALVFTDRLSSGPSLWGSPPVTPRDATLDWAVAYAAIAVALLIANVLGTTAGQRRRNVAALVERAEQLARERDQQAEIASARERERIAGEMHDIIAHSLSVIIAVADGAHAAADERPDEAKKAIARVAETGRRTLGEVRRLLGTVGAEHEGLDPHSPQPDASQLASLVTDFRDAGLPVKLTLTGSPSTDPAVGLTVYRIVQESLTNVLRHARGVEQVTVAVSWTDDAVTILVRDRTSVPTSSMDAGRGILGMRERVALFDGEIEAGPHRDGGWQVSARLQWEEDRR
jgi:signal transduction histidine kinase